MKRALGLALLVLAMMSPSVTAHAAVELALLSPAAGATVTGRLTVSATAPDGTTEVTFDRSSDAGATWTPIATDTDASDGWSAVWETAPLDGPVRIRVSANGSTAAVGVELRNAPTLAAAVDRSRFSPNGDGVADTTRFIASVNEPATVTFAVFNASDQIVRNWSTNLSAAGSTSSIWNGRDGRGRRLPDGNYRVRFTAIDAAGNATTTDRSAALDTTAPVIVWSGVSLDPSSGSTTERFTFSVRDADRTLSGAMRVRSTTRLVGSRSLRVSTGRRTVSWLPRSRLYVGTYRTEITLVDHAGNRSRTAVRAWRVERAMTPRVYTSLRDVGRTVALTFDDCYQGDAWNSILKTLRAYRVRASFFCPGETLRARPALARRTVRDGHSVGSHGWDHSNLKGRSDSFVRQRLIADRNAWWRYGGATSAPYFRPPYGAYDKRVLSIAGQTSMPRFMMWSVDSRDWTRPGRAAIVDTVVGGARPGAVILVHTIETTAGALPAILQGLRRRNLRPISLDEMFAR